MVGFPRLVKSQIKNAAIEQGKH